MRKNKKLKLVHLFLLLSVLPASCDLSKPINTNTDNSSSIPISYSATNIANAESCWLQSNNTNLGDWVGDRQCTALARLLTTAPGYGLDSNGDALGGYDYVKQQQNIGKHIPLLAEVKTNLKPCDNLILIGPGYDNVGHTVVVFYTDLVNDTIYYLDQNYNNEPITPRQLGISENEKNTYVIPAECEKPINQTCFMIFSSGQQAQPSVSGEDGFTIPIPNETETVSTPADYITPTYIYSSKMSEIENQLVGLWQGIIKIQGESPSFTNQIANFQISSQCQTNNLCLTISNEDGTNFINEPASVNIPFSATKNEFGKYCFSLDVSPEYPLFIECFTPQVDGTLLYKGSGALTYFEGILHKIKK